MQFSDLIEAAGGIGAFVSILGVTVVAALVCLAISAHAKA
jgi:hypothetical protein